jgi:hypothetical protein
MTGRCDAMSELRSLSLILIESYAEAAASNRATVEELRTIAALDQKLAGAFDRWFLAIQDLILSGNACFESLFQYREALSNYWYQIGAPYDPKLDGELIDGFRILVEESAEILADLSTFGKRGRSVVGAEDYERHVILAKGILEDDAVREQAERLMPRLDKLDALAQAHRRATGQ